jgi:hypothetical protein
MREVIERGKVGYIRSFEPGEEFQEPCEFDMTSRHVGSSLALLTLSICVICIDRKAVNAGIVLVSTWFGLTRPDLLSRLKETVSSLGYPRPLSSAKIRFLVRE